MSVWQAVVAGDVVRITTSGGNPEIVQVSVKAVTVRGAGNPPAVVLIDDENNAWVEHCDSQLVFIERAGATEVRALGLEPHWLLSRRYRGSEYEITDLRHLERPGPRYAIQWSARTLLVEVGDSGSLDGATFKLVGSELVWSSGNPSSMPDEDRAAVTIVAVAEHRHEAGGL